MAFDATDWMLEELVDEHYDNEKNWDSIRELVHEMIYNGFT